MSQRKMECRFCKRAHGLVEVLIVTPDAVACGECLLERLTGIVLASSEEAKEIRLKLLGLPRLVKAGLSRPGSLPSQAPR